MTRIDQFESLFKAAAKETYRDETLPLERGLVVTDLVGEEAERFAGRARAWLAGVLGDRTKLEWDGAAGDRFRTVDDLLAIVGAGRPDLIVTHRNLHEGALRSRYSLGVHLDVLTQVTALPVLVLPDPDDGQTLDKALSDEGPVMAVTDHLTGGHRMVSVGARFTRPPRKLILVHVEDDAVFSRYMEAIEKIPAIDTTTARQEVARQLLKEPADYIRSCREGLAPLGIEIDEIVRMGHRLRDHVDLVTEHGVSLLVLETKDESQQAMCGLSYALAIELGAVPLLML